MPLRKRQENRPQGHFTRRTGRKPRLKLRPPAHPRRLAALVLCGVAGIVLALAVGTGLKARSEALREQLEKDEWTLDASMTAPDPIAVPDLRAITLETGGSVGDILIAGKHDGVLLELRDREGVPLYASAVGMAAKLPIAEDALSLSAEIARISGRDLYTVCTFTVTCFDESDPALSAYTRGLELSLLREFAEAGMDELLLFGLPAGSDHEDALSMAFLTELRGLLGQLTEPPALGVALLPADFAGIRHTAPDTENGAEAPIYGGNISPARLRTVCDYLVMDLRAMNPEQVDTLLPEIGYVYLRHSLRLAVNLWDSDTVTHALKHGFARILEMEPPPAPQVPEEDHP